MNPNEDPETLERRSDSLRADVGDTLSELQRTLSPTALVDRSINLLRDHGGEMATTVLQTVRRNPVPVLLMAAGAAWMVSQHLQSSSSADDSYSTDDAQGGVASDDMGDDDAGNTVQNAAHTASDAVSDGVRKVKERSRRVLEGARDTSRQAGEGMARLLREQPLVVGAAGILAGALIGALLPETAQENRLLGPARDRAMQKARAAGRQQFESAKEKVNEAVDRTTESLRSGGAAPRA